MSPSTSPRRSVLRPLPLLGLALAALALAALAPRRRGRDWTTARLDSAPEELVVPDDFDPVFFEGQGFPVHSRWVKEGAHAYGELEVFVLPHAVDGLDCKNIQESAGLGVTGHGVPIVGWIERADRLYFLYRETFGRADEERCDTGPSWRIYPIYGFNAVFSFEPAT
jgi:hypothetical protein